MPAADDHAIRRALALLLDHSHLATGDGMVRVIQDAAAELGWSVMVYLADYEQRRLVALPGQSAQAEPSLAVDGTLAGRAFRTVSTLVANGAPHSLWTPLIDSAERLGVLEIVVPAETDVHGQQFRDELRWYAHLVGHLIAGKSPYSDVFDEVRTSKKERTVASELVWSLLPPLTMACQDLVISGCLEPANEVAGDFFDYAVDSGTAEVAIMDATGHDLKSGVVGAMTLAAYRNGRRQRRSLEGVMELVDETLRSYEVDTYATGIFGRLDLRTGVLTYLNAGHPAPLLMRQGKVVKSLGEGRRILFGATPKNASAAEEQLQRGDWLVLYTDGVVEARDSSRAFFGLDRFVDVLERCAADRQPAPETLRRVTHAVLDHQHGVLQDDATMLIVQWASGRERDLTVI